MNAGKDHCISPSGHFSCLPWVFSGAVDAALPGECTGISAGPSAGRVSVRGVGCLSTRGQQSVRLLAASVKTFFATAVWVHSSYIALHKELITILSLPCTGVIRAR